MDHLSLDHATKWRLLHFIQGISLSLTVSNTFLTIAASRFGLDLEQLKTCIAEYEAKEGQQNA
ncbi:hypothetical protein [Adhaeribacter aquaticus]|uniref:hypothetical protein n=1 Tax=Adhaeribacter aquaticus TaxID=299567 RepID=UPI000413CA41|nr:hypothetical protein [Adhaeribacter aquaticus]